MKPVLYMIIPCYNEEKVLPLTCGLFLNKLLSLIKEGKVEDSSRILFVDDGSADGTWKLIRELAGRDGHYLGIRQSRNRGHQNAVLAGLMEAKDRCHITVSMDCDGQDDIDAVDDMLEEYGKGSQMVYGVRSSRQRDSFFKRITAQGFYRFLKGMGAEVVYNHADYRLVSSRVLQELQNYREVNLFLRGMFPLVGFQSSCVFYERGERMAGKTHYSIKKMAGLALDGITSLSVKPIRMITVLGMLAALLGFGGIVWTVAAGRSGQTASGWSGTVCMVCFMGGIQLLCLGVLGEYIGKIYMETKARPRYIISERTFETQREEA